MYSWFTEYALKKQKNFKKQHDSSTLRSAMTQKIAEIKSDVNEGIRKVPEDE